MTLKYCAFAIYHALTVTDSHHYQANTYAAGLCHIYNSGDSNQTWYLPAINELSIVYNYKSTLNLAGAQLTVTDIGNAHGYYWSSTQYTGDSHDAWEQRFLDASTSGHATKEHNDLDRCVRAF